MLHLRRNLGLVRKLDFSVVFETLLHNISVPIVWIDGMITKHQLEGNEARSPNISFLNHHVNFGLTFAYA